MRARVAYISSLGTTAILVAAALMMLVVVGTIVAFRGWPGSENGTGVQSVPLAPPTAPARVALVRRASYARAVVRTRPVATVTRRLSTAGLVKQAGPRVVPGLVMVPAHGAPIHPASPQPGSPSGPPGGPVPNASPTSGLPTGGPDYGQVAPSGSLPAQVPAPGPPPPPADQLSVVIGQLLAAAPPPPGRVARLR